MPKDHLHELIVAIAHLQSVAANMGDGIEVSSIEIKDGHKGYRFDALMRSSPSFRDAAIYPDARNSPQVREIHGVKIKAV